MTGKSLLAKSSETWAIILAGGEGMRLQEFIKELLGQPRPKQYCALLGTRTMLEHTLDRAQRLVGPERVITIIGKGHSRYISELPSLAGQVIEQPLNLDTGPGIFLGATLVMAGNPEATVFIFPSDHFVFPRGRFLYYLAQAARVVESAQNRLVVLAAEPDGPEREYGWIEPGDEIKGSGWDAGIRPRRVLSFSEKPSIAEAQNYFVQGYLWNTMVIAAKLKTLWSLGNESLPTITRRFEVVRQEFQETHSGRPSDPNRSRKLHEIYQGMRSANFSSDLLAQAPERLVVVPMEGVQWADWGHSERVTESIRWISEKKPDFLRRPDELDCSPAAHLKTGIPP